ncbi:MAG: hypothetical protein ABWY58_06630 [Aeromicrobium sp.]
MPLDPFFRSIPLAAPGAIGCAIAFALVAPLLGRRLGVPPMTAWFFCTALGGFAALTLTPSGSALEGYRQGSTHFSASLVWPTVEQLTSTNDVSLNVAAGVTLGAAGFVMSRARRHWAPLLIVVVAPVGAEVVQWTVPQLGRSGFLLVDVLDNWIGIAVGTAVAALITVAATPRSYAAG